MKMEIVFENGKKQIFRGVKSYREVEQGFFVVKPLEIDRKLFEQKRSDLKQEEMRRLIMEAFKEMDKKPEKYASKFCTLVTEKNWDEAKTIANLKELAKNLGGHCADWVEQALEWAQRICNGESWEDICNKPDITDWFRCVIWKDGYARIVGGSGATGCEYSASFVKEEDVVLDTDKFYLTVPLIVEKF